MERKKNRYIKQLAAALCIILLTLPYAADGSGAHETFRNMIYRAYVEDRMGLWENTLENMIFEYRQHPTNELLYDIVLAKYGLTGYYLGTGKEDEGAKMLESAERWLTRLENTGKHTADAKLFRAAFNAFRITLRPIRATRLGPVSSRLINDALDLEPNNPHAHLEKGNMLFYAPPIFGGSKRRSIEHYARAVELFEQNMPTSQRWLYLSTLVSLANAYQETGDTESAMRTFRKALSFEPEFKWVRDELLPELESRR